MKKVYKIEVDCANCANLMEDAVLKIQGVETAAVNFIMQKMTVKYKDGYDDKTIISDIIRACKRIEPDCEIYI